jgi:CheY-like chemotaxis protein
MTSTDGASVTILVVDDDPGHCELIRRNLRRALVKNVIEMVHDGEEALNYVHRRGAHTGQAIAERLLLLLDINMPGAVNGLDVLQQIKGNPVTRIIPIIMLTSTDNPREMARCYELGCNIYITKPVDAQQFIDAIRRIGLFVDIVSVAPLSPEGA